eukprot:scaffold3246_cov104-Skeletonema_dohrnii-CCMP3373.AAC.4
MSGFGQSSSFGGSGSSGGGFGFPSTPSNTTGSGFSSSSTPLAFGQQQQPPAVAQPSQPQQQFGSTAFGSGGGFGTPAPPSINAPATTGFGTAITPASTATPFGSSTTTTTTATGGFGNPSSSGFGSGFGSAVAPTSNTTHSFGFGQQQQQQQSSQTVSSGFGTTTNNNNNTNVFGSSSSGGAATTTTAAAPLAFGSSSTVATPQPSAAPSTSFFGGASSSAATTTTTPSTLFGNIAASSTTTATAFGGVSGGNNNNNTATSTPFGSSSTAFGSNPSTNTTGGFGLSASTTVAGGFGSSSSSTTAAAAGANLSANAAAFTPSASSATTTGGFGSSSAAGTFGGGGGFGASVGGGDNNNNSNNNNSSGFGGGSSNKSSFGGGFGGQTVSSSTTTAFGGGGGFGTPATASTPSTTVFGNNTDGNAGGTNESSSSSFPFGSRIPRKEKAPAPQTASGGGSEASSKTSSADGDAQLAALRAKIQEKKQRLLDKKKNQQQQQQQQSNSGASSGMSPSRTTGRGMSPPRTTTDSDRNAELAAKNAMRFASQQENKALSSLLPTDLQGRAQASESNDDRTTPVGNDDGNNNDVDDDDDDLAHRNVNNAKSLIGICTSMCPDEELLRREKEGDIQLLEITDPGGLHPTHWTLRDTAVKRFRRSAADFKLDIPELVRPPEVLERVCGYLEEWVMERDRQGPDKRWAQAATTTSDTPPPLDVYQFIWDRTRMIRKDFILQNYIGTGGKCDARAVRCHERIARWHAMCEHQLSHIPDFVKHQSQQNIAELGQTMKTLNLYYDDALGRALTETASSGGSDSQGCVSDIVMGKSPIDFDGSALSNDAQSSDVSQRIIGKNGVRSPSRGTAEPEMRGLYILLTMNNEGGMEVLKYSGRLCTQKPEIFYSKPVQLALTIFRAKKDHNYAKFFRLLRCPSTPYLFSCIMFKYVESMRKETLLMMSRVYGAKHKTTGEAFYDSYPLEKLVNLLCYEDESEATEACRHYGITVEGDQVLWRHSKFREPRDPVKQLIIPLKPRKMIRTIESKLSGATRLSVCRGGVSGQGATLSNEPTSVDAEALLKDRQKAQEEMKQKLAEAKAREEAERQKQEKIKKEKIRQERLAAEKRAKEEAVRRAEQERMRKEQLERDRIEQKRQEQERIAAEEKALKEAAERAERLRLETEAREKKEREIAEAKRLAEEERKRKLAEEERIRRLEEEKRRREEEERRRIAREAELRRKAEEERIRKAKEEEERRIEMAWRQKVENARKVLICRLLRKQMRRHDSLQKSRNSLSKLDPTCTQYPTSDVELCKDLFCNAANGTEVIARRTGSCDELENQIYRLATSPRQPMDLSKLVADCMSSFLSHQQKESYPSVLRTTHVKLFKLAILLPARTPQFEQLHDTLRMWVESYIDLDEVSSFAFSSRSSQIDARVVAIIGNEDESYCKDCDAALVLLPSFTDETASVDYSEKAQELLDQNDVPRMVLVLGTDDASGRNTPSTERLLDTLLGQSPAGAGLQREGVAAPNLSDFDIAFQKCCQVLVQSHMATITTTSHIDNNEGITSLDPTLVRVPLSDLGFLCLQQLIRNMDDNGFFNNAGPNSHVALFDVCRNALSSLSHELSRAYEEVHQQWKGWPAQEFFDSERVECFFGKGYDLPVNWHEPKSHVGSELKRFFQHLLERSTLTLFVNSIVGSLPGCLQQELLIMLDNGEISSCFSTIVTMVVSGEINLVSEGQTILYLPVTKLFSVVQHAAAYEVPETVEQDVDIPDYLIYGFPSVNADLEEKENSIVVSKSDKIITGEKRTRTPAESEDNTSKRSRFTEDIVDPNLRLLQDHEEGSRQKKLKRTGFERKVDTEEEQSSKSFTSYLQALLGGDVQL